LLRLEPDLFWYAQADGDFYAWARAHGAGMDVQISDPNVFVSQVQGPEALNILKAAAGGLPEKFTYFGIARVDFGGQEVVITRTGYTNELGWEFYTEPHHDADALWAHLKAAGAYCGMDLFGLDSMNIRRIEAGILNAGADFDETTTPYGAGLGRFVDEDKDDFIGKSALSSAPKDCRVWGVRCDGGEPLIAAPVEVNGTKTGIVTAGAISPYLGYGIGIARMDSAEHGPGTSVVIGCKDGSMQNATLVEMPFYDQDCMIPRGKLVDIPNRP